MPRCYFHLAAPDQDFRDRGGIDVSDPADAHFKAVQLADRVRLFPAFAGHSTAFRRWTVKVTDDNRHPLITVIFPPDFVPTKRRRRPVNVNAARMLLLRLDEMLVRRKPGRFLRVVQK